MYSRNSTYESVEYVYIKLSFFTIPLELNGIIKTQTQGPEYGLLRYTSREHREKTKNFAIRDFRNYLYRIQTWELSNYILVTLDLHFDDKH